MWGVDRRALGRMALGPGPPPLAGRALGRGPLARGALGPGGLGLTACLDPSPASWSRNAATRDQGAPGGGGARQTLNPKP